MSESKKRLTSEFARNKVAYNKKNVRMYVGYLAKRMGITEAQAINWATRTQFLGDTVIEAFRPSVVDAYERIS